MRCVAHSFEGNFHVEFAQPFNHPKSSSQSIKKKIKNKERLLYNSNDLLNTNQTAYRYNRFVSIFMANRLCLSCIEISYALFDG